VLFFLIGQMIGLSFWENLVFAIGIIVANVPEGLLPTVTLSLAMATQRMAKKMRWCATCPPWRRWRGQRDLQRQDWHADAEPHEHPAGVLFRTLLKSRSWREPNRCARSCAIAMTCAASNRTVRRYGRAIRWKWPCSKACHPMA